MFERCVAMKSRDSGISLSCAIKNSLSFLLRPSMPSRVEGIDPNSLREEKDPFFIAVTKAPEEKESFAA